MKVERGIVEFSPLVITLETDREAKAIKTALIIAKHRGMESFQFLDQELIKQLISKLSSEGIREL